MKKTSTLLFALALLLSLCLPLLVPSGAMLESQHNRLLEEVWAQEEESEDQAPKEGGFLRFLFPTAKAESAPSYALPLDFSPGQPLDKNALTPEGYTDDSIVLTLETIEDKGVVFRVARITIKDPSQLRTATAGSPTSSKVALISSMAEKNNAVIAINANYLANDPVKTSYEYRMGQKVRAKLNRTKDLLVIDEQADFHLFIKSDKKELDEFLKSGHTIVNAFTFGPALVKDGALLTLDKNYGYNPGGDEPRMAIGQTGPLSYLLVLAEGRQQNSKGVTHAELGQFMFDQGCLQAFNLDGGNSATMVYNGGYYQQKNKSNERAQSDMIYFASGVTP